jgi:hypothetical protein
MSVHRVGAVQQPEGCCCIRNHLVAGGAPLLCGQVPAVLQVTDGVFRQNTLSKGVGRRVVSAKDLAMVLRLNFPLCLAFCHS